MKEFPLLETERLRLRELKAGDVADLLAVYSNPEITRFCEVPTLSSAAQAQVLLEGFRNEFTREVGVRWAITQKGTSRLVGLCGVGWYGHNHSALLSYDLHQDFWNRGLMTEAVRAVVRYTFEDVGMNRLTATTVLDNPRSARVLRRNGFQEEGILRDWAFWKGEFKDLRCFSLLRREATPVLESELHAASRT